MELMFVWDLQDVYIIRALSTLNATERSRTISSCINASLLAEQGDEPHEVYGKHLYLILKVILQHSRHEVWANMIHNVYAGRIEMHRFSSTTMDDPSGPESSLSGSMSSSMRCPSRHVIPRVSNLHLPVLPD